MRSERRSLLSRLARRIGRMSIGGATVFLTSLAVILAQFLNWVFSLSGFAPFSQATLFVGTAVTILTASPMCYLVMSNLREISASRRALSRMTEKLAVAFHNAEQANEAKSRFLANMSHELRTPLNAVIGFSDIMQNQRFGPIENARYVEYSRDINASGLHLLGIINDVLDLAKIESGQSNIENESDFDVIEVVRSACAMLQPLVARQNVSLSVEAPHKTIHLRAVERMIRQVLINVASNAVKYTDVHGNVRISFDCRPDGALSIVVEDTGIGMTAEEIKIALTPFGQVKNNLTNVPQGTGLGLPLAKAMMDLHGGYFAMRSQPGKGTVVSLIFPSERVTIAEGTGQADGQLTARAS